MSDILPFLSTLAPAVQTKSFMTALPVVTTPTVHTPWNPAPVAAPAPVAPQIDVAAIRAEAVAAGHAAGLAQTEALRAQLAQVIDKLAAAETAARTTHAELIADAAAAVIGAWAKKHDETIAPVIRGWLAKTQAPATAKVNPADADAVKAAIGEASISVVTDARIAAGAMTITSASHEMVHSWDDRLAELRDAILATVEQK